MSAYILAFAPWALIGLALCIAAFLEAFAALCAWIARRRGRAASEDREYRKSWQELDTDGGSFPKIPKE